MSYCRVLHPVVECLWCLSRSRITTIRPFSHKASAWVLAWDLCLSQQCPSSLITSTEDGVWLWVSSSLVRTTEGFLRLMHADQCASWTTGSSVGGVVWPIMLNHLINNGPGFAWAVRSVISPTNLMAVFTDKVRSGFIKSGRVYHACVVIHCKYRDENSTSQSKGKDRIRPSRFSSYYQRHAIHNIYFWASSLSSYSHLFADLVSQNRGWLVFWGLFFPSKLSL